MDQVSDLQDSLPSLQAPIVHVEVNQNPCSTARPAVVKEHVLRLIHKHHPSCYGDFKITNFANYEDPFYQEHINYIAVTDTDFFQKDKELIELTSASLQVHVFQLHTEGPAQEELEDEELAAANHWLLPSTDFEGLWESLVFDVEVKSQLLQYARTTLLFSDRSVDSNIISWNRVILLHGPPGTGKTSLCKALAQKLFIHMSDRYSYGQLIEINSHSLFSKWFSESGKLVMKMFQKIQELIDDPDALVCVLIDEVESLTAARKAAMSGTEPSDAIRVVNALLTQIDQIKKYPNVMILTTSNITGAIDLAFVDRADIKQYIGMPSPAAIYKIYMSCLQELMRADVIRPQEQLFDLTTLELMRFAENNATRLSLKLRDIAVSSQGLSGRTLRKLPFLAHAMFIQEPSASLEKYLSSLESAVKKQFQERQDLSNGS